MAIINLETVKVLLQISGTSKDELIETLIPMVQDDVITYCRNTFEDEDGITVWPAGIKIVAARMIGEQMAEMSGGGVSIGMESETQGGYSYTRGTGVEAKGQSGYSTKTEGMLNKWRLVGVQFAQKMQQYRDRRGLNEQEIAKGYASHGTEGFPL